MFNFVSTKFSNLFSIQLFIRDFDFRLVGISADLENSHCVLNGTYGVVAHDGHCNPQEKHDKVKLDGTSITHLSELDYSLSSNEDD